MMDGEGQSGTPMVVVAETGGGGDGEDEDEGEWDAYSSRLVGEGERIIRER